MGESPVTVHSCTKQLTLPSRPVRKRLLHTCNLALRTSLQMRRGFRRGLVTCFHLQVSLLPCRTTVWTLATAAHSQNLGMLSCATWQG